MPSYSLRDICIIAIKELKRRMGERTKTNLDELNLVLDYSLPKSYAGAKDGIRKMLFTFRHLKVNKDKTISVVE